MNGSETDRDPAPTPHLLDGLYRRYGGWLTGMIRRRFGAHAAEDLLQETYLRLSGASNSEIRHPRAYLMRIATNVAYDQARRTAARGGRYSVELERASDDEMLQIAADQETQLLLKQIVLGLPEFYRDVFILSRLGGLSHEEIAEVEGVSVKAVEYRISKALAICEAQLRR